MTPPRELDAAAVRRLAVAAQDFVDAHLEYMATSVSSPDVEKARQACDAATRAAAVALAVAVLGSEWVAVSRTLLDERRARDAAERVARAGAPWHCVECGAGGPEGSRDTLALHADMYGHTMRQGPRPAPAGGAA